MQKHQLRSVMHVMTRAGALLLVGLLLVSGCAVFDTAPKASFTASPALGVAPLPVSFDASGSQDIGGTIARYEWSFGHEKTSTGKTTQHTFDVAGTYTVTLTVTDSSGKTGAATKMITVIPQGSAPPPPPTQLDRYPVKQSTSSGPNRPHKMSDYPKGEESTTLTVAGWHMIALPGELEGSCAGSCGDLICALSDDLDPCYIFHFDPAIGGYQMAPPASAICHYVGMGFWVRTYEDNVTIDADLDASQETTNVPLREGWNQIGNPFPFAVPTELLQVVSGDTTLSLADAQAQGWISAYLFTYDSALGGYVMLDPASGSLSPWTGYWLRAYQDCTLQIAAPNQSPTASFSADPSSGDAPLLVAFDASGSSDSDGTISSYAWDFGDGGNSSGVSTTYTYTGAGTYTAQLTVTDDDGATDTTTTEIEVSVPSISENLYVDANSGSDTTGDGSEGNPYKTITKALAVASTDSEPHSVHVAEGVYNTALGEDSYFTLQQGIHLIGEGPTPEDTRVFSSVWCMSGSTLQDIECFWGIHVGGGQGADIVLDNVHVSGPDSYTVDGIEIYRASNVLISNCLVEGANYGISLKYSSSIDINESSISDCREGVLMRVESSATIENTRIDHCGCGIHFYYLGGVELAVENTVVTDNDTGIRLEAGDVLDLARLYRVYIATQHGYVESATNPV